MGHEQMLALAAGCLLGVGVAGGGCEVPVDPGSDLPDSSAPAQLGPNIDVGRRGDVQAQQGADISGTFELQARVTSPMGGGAMPMAFVAVFDQMGAIDEGEATVGVELRAPGSPDEPGPSTEQPGDVSEAGTFEAAITGYTVAAEDVERLEADADADVSLDAQIVDGDCVEGDISVTMRDVEISGVPNPIPTVELDGPFTANRQGTDGCGGSGQMDAGSGGGDAGRGDTTDSTGAGDAT